jgi:hypothetical protein
MVTCNGENMVNRKDWNLCQNAWHSNEKTYIDLPIKKYGKII